jgi:hypothetical protein
MYFFYKSVYFYKKEKTMSFKPDFSFSYEKSKILEKYLYFRALRTMIDLGRLTRLCIDCPQIIPIAGDLTMNGENRHIYRLGYQGAQSFGPKVKIQNNSVKQHESLLHF